MTNTPEQLLVVDDSAVVRETLSTVLKSNGYQVTVAANAAAALRLAAARPFHLAFLDINLPDGNGIDLIKPLHERQPHLAVIVLTGEASAETAIQALNVGATAYLKKPWDEEKALAAVREALEKQRLTLENERLVGALQAELAQRRRAERRAKRQRAVAEALAETAALINSSLEINQVLDEILTRVGQVVPHDSANFMVISGGVARVIRSHSRPGWPPDNGVLGLRFQVNKTPTLSQMAETLEPVIIPDTSQSADWTAQSVSKWIRSYAGVPLIGDGEVVGFLSLNSATPGFFTRKHVRRLRTFAHYTGVAIRNASLYAKTKNLLKMTEGQARQMHQLFQTVSDGLVLLDQSRQVAMQNHLGQEYLRLLCGNARGPIDHLGSRTLDTLLPDSTGDVHRHTIETGAPEHRIFELRVHFLSAQPDDGWLLALHDATEEREHQKHLERQNQLATVGRLAAGIAHDFNNIMGVITLYAQILLGEDLSEKNRERTGVILEQALSASALIRQILDFSRQSVLERGPLHLISFLKEFLKLSQRTLPESIRMEFRYGDDDYDIYADATRIQQAMLNLIVNARDAMPRGGSLIIALERLGKDYAPSLPDMPQQEWLHLSVSDTGSGIAPDVLPHIFEPFFTTKPLGEGTGLGLAQVYGIVKQHEGFIDVTSRPGQGTIFHLFFPPLIVPKTGILTLPPQTGPLAVGELVMVVEDNAHIRAAVCETLEALNYRVIVAADGMDALQKFKTAQEEIRVVLSDMVMPHMSGKQLYEELHCLAPGLGMIFFSGYPLDEESRALCESGNITWLEKPFTRSAVANAIRAVSRASFPYPL